jgi:quinol monooxygenase YgiN
MGGLLIEYEYDGDDAPWTRAIESFLQAIAADAKLAGRLRYHVFVKADGKSRVHVPSWDSQETLAHLQSQDFFKVFADAVGGFAGGAPRTTKIRLAG